MVPKWFQTGTQSDSTCLIRLGRFKLTYSGADALWIMALGMTSLAVLYYLSWPMGPVELFTGRRARAELLGLWSSIELGESPKEFLDIFNSRKTRYLKLDKDIQVAHGDKRSSRTMTVWRIRTPSRLGANWLMFLEFSANGELVAIRIRLADAYTVKPARAPHDRIVNGCTAIPLIE